MGKNIIIVEGYLASGKSTFARWLSKELRIPCLIKDTFKTALCSSIPIADRRESSRFSAATFDGMLYVAERMFECGYPIIIEGNFVPGGIKAVDEAEAIRQLIHRYGYSALTFKFSGDTRILHHRFTEREKTPERGQANRIGSEVSFADFDAWCHNLDAFDVEGTVIRVDGTDFEKVDYRELAEAARRFLDRPAMQNPWEEIPLTDYENHMKLDSVRQLQTMNEMMRGQFAAYPVSSVMILGIAGGNGLEHVQREKFHRVYGIDVNPSYLKEAAGRYPHLEGVLQCICIDLRNDADKLPEADMVIANLLVEYIGYKCFQNVIRQVRPGYVSCIIQINMDDSWVSDSPYLAVFDKLEEVHHQMEEQALEKAMREIGYRAIKKSESMLPNGKKLVQMDFACG